MPIFPFMRHVLRGLAALLIAMPVCSAGFADHPAAAGFITEMQTFGIPEQETRTILRRLTPQPVVLKYILPPATPQARSWQRYRQRYIEPVRIRHGLRFWQQHQAALEQASQRFGIPPAIIVAILGVETIYGRHTGQFEVASALATLAFDYPPRAELFRRELRELLLLARSEQRDPLSYHGSFAGAIGLPQFLPGSIRRYAIDFDEDGHVDLEGSTTDAIGSVANFLHAHGWEHNQPIAVPAGSPARVEQNALQDALAAGIEPRLEVASLRHQGWLLPPTTPTRPVALIDLVSPGADTEYWLGYRNFWVITRYNRSSFYAMSVFELAQALCQRQSSASGCPLTPSPRSMN